MHYVFSHICFNGPKMIHITETWLLSYVLFCNSRLFCDNYFMFRADTVYTDSKLPRSFAFLAKFLFLVVNASMILKSVMNDFG
jgi:hypothetical protein